MGCYLKLRKYKRRKGGKRKEIGLATLLDKCIDSINDYMVHLFGVWENPKWSV